ncbi:S-adenosyl-L-methionine-dependent methyltransferase [Gymnopilus junonius]|uniref:S-adenosyl-L-methionine-dependent methyltransferase n=1 Tax=Gymnopilus junonius TaxID=109634 RepID=A0A9P5NEC0_GYMJU|nr:S-adenosyl-L-methionine-dependent methyltransferase [Gymnopilus junonius]
MSLMLEVQVETYTMSTFAKATFNASTYSASRPTYPPQLFEYIFSFHRRGSKLKEAQWQRAVDVGCGTGQATVRLRPFREVIGIDPSHGMLEKARAYAEKLGQENQSNIPKFNFVQGSAEDLSTAISENGSVDLLVAAQAAHWFDWSKVWPETFRVLRRGGTAAFWVYAEFRLPEFPALGPRITTYAQGSDPLKSVGNYFQRPGRTILERHLADVPDPSSFIKGGECEEFQRVYFCGDNVPDFIPKNAPIHPVLMRTEMRWRDLLSYFRTWSALHTYHEKNPDDLKQPADPRFLDEDLANSSEPLDELRAGDIAIRFWKDLREGALKANPNAEVGAEDMVQVEWPVALLLARKG